LFFSRSSRSVSARESEVGEAGVVVEGFDRAVEERQLHVQQIVLA
jgi:hypothetical protein